MDAIDKPTARSFDVRRTNEEVRFIVVTCPSRLDTRAQTIFLVTATTRKAIATFDERSKRPGVSELTIYYDLDRDRLSALVDEQCIMFRYGNQKTQFINVEEVENATATLEDELTPLLDDDGAPAPSCLPQLSRRTNVLLVAAAVAVLVMSASIPLIVIFA